MYMRRISAKSPLPAPLAAQRSRAELAAASEANAESESTESRQRPETARTAFALENTKKSLPWARGAEEASPASAAPFSWNKKLDSFASAWPRPISRMAAHAHKIDAQVQFGQLRRLRHAQQSCGYKNTHRRCGNNRFNVPTNEKNRRCEGQLEGA